MVTERLGTIDWGIIDDKKVYLYTVTNTNGTEIKITNYGGIITSWITSDKKGNRSNVVLGFDSLNEYLAEPPYFGAIIGRYGNRIANAQFKIDDVVYQLAKNIGKNHLHGGFKGFDKVVWNVEPVNEKYSSVTFTHVSKDTDEGFPGNLDVRVSYTLTDRNELIIEYNAYTDKATPVNLSNHSYFNLTGDATNTILNHQLQINADAYTPVDEEMIPTGELKSVKDTPFDFLQTHRIGERIALVEGGYDHNYVLGKPENESEPVAVLSDPFSGRILEVYTTMPGLQLYTGNFLDGTFKTSHGQPIQKQTAVCLETQQFPDSPNQPQFPSSVLRPGVLYHSITKYRIIC
jgi:aldose 1-epimerase